MFGLAACNGFPGAPPWVVQSCSVRPSMRKPASREMISASVELCETEVCFLHIQLTGTNV